MPPEENGVVTTNSDAIASTETSAPADVGDSSTDVNWSDMALEMDQGDDGESGGTVEGDSEVVEASENATQPSSEPPPAATTPPAAAPTEAPPTVASTQTPPAQAPAPQTPPTPSQEPPAQPQQTYAEWRGKQLEGLEKHYTLDEDLATKMLTEPETVLPKLAAQLHMEVTEHVMRSVMAAMPQWMDGFTQSRSRETEAEQVFYGANPDLKDPAYKNAVIQMGKAYRAMNPNAPAEEAVKVIGNMVRTAMGLQAPQAPAGMTVAQPAAPAAPAPFVPARGGGGAAVPTPSSSNPWSQMAEEFLTD